tara:strand:+ start:751 stop:1062 length:312 start_codon:yes stop_codon:yes gene_type:complete
MYNWTQEKFNHAKEQYDLKIPASKIARELGTTKNSVLGKIHRYRIKHGHKKETKRHNNYYRSASHFKKIGTSFCYLCNKVYSIFSVHDRFCDKCKRSEFYRNS